MSVVAVVIDETIYGSARTEVFIYNVGSPLTPRKIWFRWYRRKILESVELKLFGQQAGRAAVPLHCCCHHRCTFRFADGTSAYDMPS